MYSNRSHIASLLTVVCAVLFGMEGSGMRIGNTGAFLTGKLPYDSEVEYLESTGPQWIDTGVFGNLHTRIEIVIEVANFTDHYALCGFLLSGSSAQITVPANYNDAGLYARFGDKLISGGMVVSEGKHTFTSDRSGLTIDGVSRGTFGATANFTTPSSLAIFRFKGLNRNFFIGRMFSCKFHDGSSLVRDLIPVRFTNEQGQSEGAMYDRANPTVGMNPDGSARTDGLYRNRGMGAFTWAKKT